MTTAATPALAQVHALLGRLTGDAKHELAATSTLDVLWVLYDRVLRVDPAHPDDPDRDRFLLSKGHGPMAFYAVLAARGFIDPAVLDTFVAFDSPLGAHPDRTLLPGVEISSGSLGHGLPLGVGTALGLRASGRTRSRVVVLIGDGELDEGSNHEAIAFAAAAGLDALTVVVVDNASSRHGWRGGIAGWFEVAGWDAVTVDGRDHDQLGRALADRRGGSEQRGGRPNVVVARVLPAGRSVA
jgi:transketolase